MARSVRNGRESVDFLLKVESCPQDNCQGCYGGKIRDHPCCSHVKVELQMIELLLTTVCQSGIAIVRCFLSDAESPRQCPHLPCKRNKSYPPIYLGEVSKEGKQAISRKKADGTTS